MRPDQRKSPVPGRDQAGAENVEASNLKVDSITNVIAIPSAGWKIAVRRAHAKRLYKGRAKVLAVRHWRVAVVDTVAVRT